MEKKKSEILIVDDEITILKLLQNFLNQEFKTNIQKNGEDALAWLQEGNIPDLIIADIQMPGMDGFDFIKSVRASGFFEDIPIMMLSGNEQSSDRIRCLRLGADDYIVKPFNPEELMLRVNIILRRTYPKNIFI